MTARTGTRQGATPRSHAAVPCEYTLVSRRVPAAGASLKRRRYEYHTGVGGGEEVGQGGAGGGRVAGRGGAGIGVGAGEGGVEGGQ